VVDLTEEEKEDEEEEEVDDEEDGEEEEEEEEEAPPSSTTMDVTNHFENGAIQGVPHIIHGENSLTCALFHSCAILGWSGTWKDPTPVFKWIYESCRQAYNWNSEEDMVKAIFKEDAALADETLTLKATVERGVRSRFLGSTKIGKLLDAVKDKFKNLQTFHGTVDQFRRFFPYVALKIKHPHKKYFFVTQLNKTNDHLFNICKGLKKPKIEGVFIAEFKDELPEYRKVAEVTPHLLAGTGDEDSKTLVFHADFKFRAPKAKIVVVPTLTLLQPKAKSHNPARLVEGGVEELTEEERAGFTKPAKKMMEYFSSGAPGIVGSEPANIGAFGGELKLGKRS